MEQRLSDVVPGRVPGHSVPDHHHPVRQETVPGEWVGRNSMTSGCEKSKPISIQDLDNPGAYGMLESVNVRIATGEGPANQGEIGAW